MDRIRYRTLVLLLFISTSLYTPCEGDVQKYCDDLTPSDVNPKPTDPQFPAIPESFSTDIEANFAEQSTSYRISMYYEPRHLSAALIEHTPNGPWYNLFTYRRMLNFDIRGSSCQVKPIWVDPGALWGVFAGATGPQKPYSSEQILAISNKIIRRYVGTKYIRGIAVDHWKTCFNQLNNMWSNYSANIDYYFAINTSNHEKRYPKRIAILGNFEYKPNMTMFIRHSYEFTYFTDQVPQSVFEIPPGVYCEGMDFSDSVQGIPKMPEMPSAFIIYYEITRLHHKMSIQGSFTWDYDRRLAKMVQRQMTRDPKMSLDLISTVDDFNTGISYKTDFTTFECSIQPIDSNTIEAIASTDTKTEAFHAYTFTMNKQVMPLLSNNKFHFSGKRRVDGVLCDVFVVGNSTQDVAIEALFTSANWTVVPRMYGTPELEKRAPIKIIYYRLGEIESVLRFSQLQVLHPDHSQFSISHCLGPDKIIRLQLSISVPGKNLTDFHENEIKTALRPVLIKLADITSIRVSREYVYYGSKSKRFLYLFSLSEKPQDIKKFHSHQQIISERETKVVKSNVPSASACASYCMEEKSIDCSSFEYCVLDKTCRLSILHGPVVGAELTPKPACVFYTTNVEKPKHELMSWLAYKQLYDQIFEGKFQFKLTNKKESVTAKVVNIYFIKDGSSSKFAISSKYWHDFKVHYGIVAKMTLSLRLADYKGLSMTECVTKCDDQWGDECLGANYCVTPTSKSCILTTHNKHDANLTYYIRDGCWVIEREYFKDGQLLTKESIMYRKSKNNTNKIALEQHKGLSPGEAAGLSIGMMFLGSLILVIGFIVFLKVRGKTLDKDFVVTLSKIEPK